ncbi:polysaccharide export protein EpsE [Chitiniphilus purpureus]|uniref:Polysaccharide export protein EpsE n=1 Tax=Chitiniphilus purpureus TaxID=2981137 RepID=A0ABY6DMC5_9NEIS|nr:polysaccharide export protein EpsE [Chitiniphilus sp. CD1]UXY14636.1 polysaccharide export protein EpsE [Chitiniphilus sp. CD1]
MMRGLWLRTLALCCALLIGLSATAAERSNEYLLGAGDVVKISVYDHPDLMVEAQLTQAGEISFPLLGTIRLAGMSFSQAEAHVASLLHKGGFVNKPSINVLITQYRSQRVAVLGEVSNPGRYALDSASTVIDALALAGGVNPNGGDLVVLTRGNERHEYSLAALLARDGSAQAVSVQAGDVLYVPRSAQVYVYGEVNRPGSFRLERNMTVMQAISVAGGYNVRASQKGLQVNRTKPDGSTELLEVKPTDLLRPNDVVFVREALF